MAGKPTMRQVMTPFPYTIDAEAPVLEARKLMLHHRVRHLPVVRGERLVGLISDRDIKLMLGPELDYPDPREVTVSDVMIEQPYAVDVNAPLIGVLRHMAQAHIGTALITSNARLAGIFTAMDACRHLAEHLERASPEAGEDR